MAKTRQRRGSNQYITKGATMLAPDQPDLPLINQAAAISEPAPTRVGAPPNVGSMRRINDKLYCWASDIEQNTIDQAARTARLDIVYGHVALMPDAHFGLGSTVGSVIPTLNAVIPAAVGVDLGCGMAAVRLNMRQDQLPDNLDRFLPILEQAVPAGLGRWHEHASAASTAWLEANPAPSDLGQQRMAKALNQFGTLGSGNHYIELSIDGDNGVWVSLHSGSRGIGNQLAQDHIQVARGLAERDSIELEDPDLAWLSQGTPQFDAYIADMLWAQRYAKANRDAMMDAILHSFAKFAKTAGLRANTLEAERISCHHNFTALEHHDGHDLWVTRKGAIKADKGDRGIIPGSMGTGTYIVTGLGNSASWNSCSHGAGRRMSRGEARRSITPAELKKQMAGKIWLADRADQLVDESPAAYKNIEQVMADQADLVQVDTVLHQILNYKGSEPHRQRRPRPAQ